MALNRNRPCSGVSLEYIVPSGGPGASHQAEAHLRLGSYADPAMV